MATAQANADDAAAPLDQLLVDVGAGPLRRWLPGRPGVEFIASLAGTEQGSWWGDYVGWLTERGGPQKPSPAELGTIGLAPLADAPGTYVFES
jgi:hypothetical protein